MTMLWIFPIWKEGGHRTKFKVGCFCFVITYCSDLFAIHLFYCRTSDAESTSDDRIWQDVWSPGEERPLCLRNQEGCSRTMRKYGMSHSRPAPRATRLNPLLTHLNQWVCREADAHWLGWWCIVGSMPEIDGTPWSSRNGFLYGIGSSSESPLPPGTLLYWTLLGYRWRGGAGGQQ